MPTDEAALAQLRQANAHHVADYRLSKSAARRPPRRQDRWCGPQSSPPP
jgi:hypothetical protein